LTPISYWQSPGEVANNANRNMLTESFANLNFFAELAIVVCAALVGSYIARLTRQPAILGYILGGIMVSPFTWGPSIADVHHFDEIAEFGVILLMFTIGAEFSPKELSKVRSLALVGGPIGVILMLALGGLVGWLMGWPWTTGIALGAVISAASTMVLGRLLIDRGILKTETGRITIGLSLVDDMAVVVMIVLLPVLSSLTPDAVGNLGLELGRAFLILAPVVFLSSRAIPWLLGKVHAWDNKEFLFIFTISLPIGMAAFTEWLGLSLALGAFLGGLLISNAPEGHRAAVGLHGLRDLCVAVFFVSVGAMIDPGQILAEPGLLLLLLGMILIGKSLVWTLVIRIFGSNWRTSFRCALYLAQIGEFSFILVAVAMQADLLTSADSNSVLAAALLSILANSLITRFITPAAPAPAAVLADSEKSTVLP